MAAPRRYSDAQRAAMFALYEQGNQPAEIARRCAAGLASVAPFQIPRRTVQEIVTAMARERDREDLPHSIEDVLDGDSRELAARYPSVVLGLINADSERLREKCARSPLTLDEYNRLRAGLAIHKLIVGQPGQPASPSRKGGRRHGGTRKRAQDHQESVLQRIGRELEEEQRETSSREHERAEEASEAASPQ